MQTIGDLTYISTILDCSELTSSSPMYDLLGSTDISATEVVSVTSGSCTVTDTTPDQMAFHNACSWLISKDIVDSEATLSALLATNSKSDTHHLRAGEMIKIVLYTQLYAHSRYAYDGYPAPQVAVLTPDIISEVRLAGGALANSQGYVLANGQGQVLNDDGGFVPAPGGSFGYGTYGYTYPYAECNVSMPARQAIGMNAIMLSGYALGYDHDGSLLTSDVSIGNALSRDNIVSALRNAFDDLGGSPLFWSDSMFIDVRATLRKAGGAQYEWSTSIRSKNGTQENPWHTISVYTFGSVYNIPVVLEWSSFIHVGKKDDPSTESGTWDWIYSSGTSRAAPIVTYIPDTRYDGQVYHGTDYTYDFGSYQIRVQGSGSPDSATVTATGTISGSVGRVQYRAIGKTIDDPTSLSITIPTQLGSDDVVPIVARFSPRGRLQVVPNDPAMGYNVLATRDEVRSATTYVDSGIDQYDRVTVYENFEDITVDSLRAALGDNVIIDDTYLRSALDYTIHLVCASQVDAIKQYMLDDAGELNTNGVVMNYFETYTLSARHDIKPWARIRLQAEDAYYPVDNAAAIGVAYDPSTKQIYPINGSVDVHVENFVYNDKSLDEWWYSRDDADDLYQALEDTKQETDTQILLFQATNGVLNATDWLSDVGQVLSDAVSAASDAAQSILGIVGPYKAITREQRYALLGSEAAIAVPATRVAEMLESASAMGATSASAAMDVLSSMPSTVNSDYSIAQIQTDRARQVVDMIASLTPWGDSKLNSTQPRPKRETSVSYWRTQSKRLGSSIISAGGADGEIADLGTGACAIYPALLNGTVFLGGFDFGLANDPIILPFKHALAVVYPGVIPNQYVVCWYAKHFGGSDYDALVSLQLAMNELGTIINPIANQFGDSYDVPTLVDGSFTGDDANVDLVSQATYFTTGGLIGAGLLMGTGPGALIGFGIGASIGMLIYELQNQAAEETNASDNLDYTLTDLGTDAGVLHYGGDNITDPTFIGNYMAMCIMALVSHGAFYPYYSQGTQLRDEGRFALFSPGNPYFRYVVVGEHEDYTPIITTIFTAATLFSLKTTLRGWRNPARIPQFLPVMLGGKAASAAALGMNAAAAAVTIEREPTLAMQKKILEEVQKNEVSSEPGVYIDSEGSVNLRDIITAIVDVRQLLNSLQLSVESTKPTYLSY